MTIGELSAKSGVPASTLRYWERMKILPKPMRISGQRRYQPEAFNLVAVLPQNVGKRLFVSIRRSWSCRLPSSTLCENCSGVFNVANVWI
jgi:hypothetical protein